MLLDNTPSLTRFENPMYSLVVSVTGNGSTPNVISIPWSVIGYVYVYLFI